MSDVPRMSEEQFQQRMLDYLYDELEPAARLEFERALEASPSWRRELDELADTLALSRRALSEAQEPAPAASRARALEEARKQAQRWAQAGAQRATTAQRTRPMPSEPTQASWLDGVRQWLFRPWLLSTATAMAAFALYVATREQTDPKRLPPVESAPSLAEPKPSSAATGPTTNPTPAPAGPGAALEAADSIAPRPTPKDDAPSLGGPSQHSRAPTEPPAVQRRVEAASRTPAKRDSKARQGVGSRLPQGAGSRAKAKTKRVARRRARSSPAARPKRRAPAPAKPASERKSFAAPPTDWARQGVRPVMPRAAAVAEPPPTTPQPVAPSRSRRRVRARPEVNPAVLRPRPAPGLDLERTELDEAAARGVVASPARASDAKRSLERKADRMFADQRFAEAQKLYRALVRRFPRDPAAKRWRQRLRLVEQALAE